jgi:hypothetical protein
MQTHDEQQFKSALKQYQEGAITFTEFVFYAASLITEDELREWNEQHAQDGSLV